MFYFALEVSVILMFFVVLRDAITHIKKDPKKLAVLVLAFVYIMVFENLNMLMMTGKAGSYFYNSNFMIFMGSVPIFISLLWTILIYTAMHLTDDIELSNTSRAFLDSLAVLLLSLMLLVVFSRQGVITWIGYSAHQGWFGAPANHLIAVMLMTFIFCYLFRYFTEADNTIINKTTRALYYFLLPAFAYLIMLGLFSAINFAEDMMKLSYKEELFMLWALVILFAVMLKKRDVEDDEPQFHSDKQTTHTIIFVRLTVLFFIIWSMTLGDIHKETPLLPILLTIIIFAELLLYFEAFEEVKIEKALERY